MSPHEPAPIERHCDVAIVGGSAAGLAAALQLVRQARTVIVLDDGQPRNAPAAHMHSYLGWDGASPSALLDAGRAEVRRYGGEILHAHATSVRRTDDGAFRVDVGGGHGIVARRLIAATGVEDLLPDVDGLAEQWGRGVIHCPFCHGFEVRERRIVHVVTHPSGMHPVALLRRLTDRLTVLIDPGIDVGPTELETLRAGGVVVVSGTARRIVDDGARPDGYVTAGRPRPNGHAAETAPGGRVTAVELADGTLLDADAVLVGPRFRPRIEAFATIGLRATPHPSGLGENVVVDATGATTVPGLYAAGTVTDPGLQVLPAAADGSRVGAIVAFSLADEDLRNAARPSGVRTDWDQRYSGDAVWSGNPNGTVVNEISDLAPGRALDVGAGEGGDALWLAARGWTVTASDISDRALDRMRATAKTRGLSVEGLHADANALDAFPAAAFDLVTASYASFPRTPDDRGLSNVLNAVAPGGTLLVLGHDLTPRHGDGSHAHASLFDADAYVQVGDFAAAVSDSPEWTIDVYETRPRPAGAVSTGHVDDVVLRARRRSKL